MAAMATVTTTDTTIATMTATTVTGAGGTWPEISASATAPKWRAKTCGTASHSIPIRAAATTMPTTATAANLATSTNTASSTARPTATAITAPFADADIIG